MEVVVYDKVGPRLELQTTQKPIVFFRMRRRSTRRFLEQEVCRETMLRNTSVTRQQCIEAVWKNFRTPVSSLQPRSRKGRMQAAMESKNPDGPVHREGPRRKS